MATKYFNLIDKKGTSTEDKARDFDIRSKFHANWEFPENTE